MATPATTTASVLVVRIDTRLAALPLRDVIETMRPLPVEGLPGTPPSVLGLSIIRGAAVPVLDLRLLLGLRAAPCTRFVTTRLGERCVALAVDEVVGMRDIPTSSLESLPPLLGEAHSELVTSIAALDRELLMVLRASRRLLDPIDEAVRAAGSTV